MEDVNIAWSDMPIDEHRIIQDYPVDIEVDNNESDKTVYISPNNVFWGYLTTNIISQTVTNLDKFIKKKFYIIGKNKRGVKKLYEYRKFDDVMYVCNDKKLYTITDNTLVETFIWDYPNKIQRVEKQFKQVYTSKIFIYTWMYLDNFCETDTLIDAYSGDEVPLPNNVNELKDVKFYFISNDTESKHLFKIRKGSGSYYIADNGNLYMIDEHNNLVPGFFKNRSQKWIEVNRIEDI